MRGARFRDEKLCSCAGWRFNCGGAIITANTVLGKDDMRDDAISGFTDVNGESAALVSLVAWRCHDGSAAFGTVIIEKGDAQRILKGKGYVAVPVCAFQTALSQRSCCLCTTLRRCHLVLKEQW